MVERVDIESGGNSAPMAADRIGVAALARVAFAGESFDPFSAELVSAIRDGRAGPGALMDLSTILQLSGAEEEGLAMQAAALDACRHYRTVWPSEGRSLKVLALAASVGVGANAPLDFLLAGSDIELSTLYFTPDDPIEGPAPEHDVAIVAAPVGLETSAHLREIAAYAARLETTVLNPPQLIGSLERDRFPRLMRGAPGVYCPPTVRAYREELEAVVAGRLDLAALFVEPVALPVVIRPLGSQAGRDLARLETLAELSAYLEAVAGRNFFVAPFVDYSDADGLFRKMRIAFVEGAPIPVHMAIGEQWSLWCANAGMEAHPARRDEERAFLEGFQNDFRVRHAQALGEIASRAGLDYFGIDCAETRDGKLLVFEADNAMLVHDMDPPEVFPYKPAAFRAVADAFMAMLRRRCAAEEHGFAAAEAGAA